MKRIGLILLGAMILLASAPVLAQSQAFESAVLQTGSLTGTVFQRYYAPTKAAISPGCSTSCGASGVNCDLTDAAQPACKLTFGAKGLGGYRGYTEDIFNFGANFGDNFYSVFDYEANAGTGTHTGYYAWTSGPVANGATSLWNVADCTGTNGSACLGNSTSSNAVAQTNTPQSTIGAVGGLSPIPVPKAFDIDGDGNAYTKGGVKGTFQVKWDAVTATGKAPGVAAAGYDLYFSKSSGACGTAPTQFTFLKTVTATQAEVGFAEVGLSSATEAACVTFALKVRFPANSTGAVITSKFLSANGQSFGTSGAATVYDLSAKFIGRTNVEVGWKTSLEDGVQAFNVLRATSANGAFQKIGTVPAKGTASSYSFIDTLQAPAGPVAVSGLFYKVEAIDMDNSATAYGPVKVTLGQDRPITVQKPAVKKHR